MGLGICLAGGGVKGAAHIGVLKAMLEENVRIEYISGTSSGSIVAALYAVGYSIDEIYDIFIKYGKKIKYGDIKNVFKLIVGLVFKRKIIIKGLNNGEIIEKIINEACKNKNYEKMRDIEFPILIPSVDLNTGEIYLFTSKMNRNNFIDNMIYENNISIAKAVRASCSYPGIFSPCKFKNRELIDGGIRENIPWRGTKELGAKKVISVIFSEETNPKCCSNLIEVITNSINILCHELSNYEIKGSDYILKLNMPNVSLLDTKKINELYNIGYIQTKKFLKENKNKLIYK